MRGDGRGGPRRRGDAGDPLDRAGGGGGSGRPDPRPTGVRERRARQALRSSGGSDRLRWREHRQARRRRRVRARRPEPGGRARGGDGARWERRSCGLHRHRRLRRRHRRSPARSATARPWGAPRRPGSTSATRSPGTGPAPRSRRSGTVSTPARPTPTSTTCSRWRSGTGEADECRSRTDDPARADQQAVRRSARGRRRLDRDRPRRVLLDARSERVREDDDAADDRRLRGADDGQGDARRRGRDAGLAAAPERQHGLPGLRAVPAHVGRRERRVRAEAEAGPADRGAGADRGDALRRPPRGARRPPARGALRRPAPARRPGAGARQPARRPCSSTSRSAPST